MPAAVSIELKGLRETQRATDELIRNLQGPPMLTAMREATLLVTRTARQEAKVDTGRYRASITPDVRSVGTLVEGAVGSALKASPFIVLDTRPHWPPRAALEVWARRHHIPVFVVMRAIARRGTKGDQSLIKGITENTARIERLLGDGVTACCDIWGKAS